ncbi:hypothetical protein RFI_04676 [Reticulomyxa filosa]|uniref:Uncharacterized protein n=1 Tax=Reticulomyxa filosa TaxID=46433 RepID=X6P2K6_RETFI|nr:hypothetical protein RFI_04676 [Reticulomyxa filosa]|eukprot:ETO32441.1 hypothetical protein RFI_04676 [Reticulomyxa filosa]
MAEMEDMDDFQIPTMFQYNNSRELTPDITSVMDTRDLSMPMDQLLITHQSDAVDKNLVPALSRDRTDGNRNQSTTSQRRWFGDIWNALLRHNNNNATNGTNGTPNNSTNNKSNLLQKSTSEEKRRLGGMNNCCNGTVHNQTNNEYFHFPYGEPDTFFSVDPKQRHNLALPMNVRGSKKQLRLLLENFLNDNALSDNVISTHPAVVEQITSSLASRDSEYKGTRMFQQTLKSQHASHDSNCFVHTSVCSSFLQRDFDETKVRITDLDFEAFVRLHKQHVNLDYISLLQTDKDADRLKKDEYEFYLKLPSSVLYDSIHPAQPSNL